MPCFNCLAFLLYYFIHQMHETMKAIFLKQHITFRVILLLALMHPAFGFKTVHDTVFQNDKILVGKWITEENDVIEFYQSNKIFEGKIILLNDKSISIKHPEIIGSIVFKKLELIKGEFVNGTYYDIESKESYPVTIKVISSKVIKLKFGTGLFSQSSEFKKVI
jgi:Uncharacterized protein conserved in bacteria (DUF2147)